LTEEKVRTHICKSSGTSFDPQVVDAFMQLSGKFFSPAQMAEIYPDRPMDEAREGYLL
jgi:response regulator RpfG family c-di-GMP phosphodiesterase